MFVGKKSEARKRDIEIQMAVIGETKTRRREERLPAKVGGGVDIGEE